jgi:hypothetical protein
MSLMAANCLFVPVLVTFVDAMATIKNKSKMLMDNIPKTSGEERLNLLKDVSGIFQSTIQQGEEKVTLATMTYDMVTTLCMSLSSRK